MNIGQKINLLFEHSGYKNYADWGKSMGLPGDWLLELKKKSVIKTVDVTRLITIAKYNQITLDELLKDDDDNYILDINSDMEDNDIYKLLGQIQTQLEEDEVKFNGFVMNKESKEITFDAIDVLKKLIKFNL